MKGLKIIRNHKPFKENSITRTRSIFFILFAFLFLIGCNSGEWNQSSIITTTEPSGYLHVSVSPGDIVADSGEQVVFSCSIMSLINTEVEIHSVDLALFDSNDTLIRQEPLNFEDYWSGNVTYTINGDEAYYSFLIDFSINPLNPEYFSEYTDSFTIETVSSIKIITKPSGYLHVSVSPGDIVADSGKQVVFSCSIMPLINTEVEIHSVDLALFDSNDTLIRQEPLNFEDYWSGNVTYTINGDEAYYSFLIDFSINPLNPEYFSEYTDAFMIEKSLT